MTMSRRWLGLLVFVLWVGSSGVAHAAPQITVSPDSPPAVDFGSARERNAAATPTRTRTFQISNTGFGNPPLTITDITFSSLDYRLNPAPTFPLTIMPGSSQNVTVEFNPSIVGTRNATMTIENNDANKTISLTGTGTAAVISVTDTIDFGVVPNATPSSRNLSITNTVTMSQGPLIVTSATITGSTFFRFSNTLGCNNGTTCTFNPPLVITSGVSTVPIVCEPPAAASGTSTGTVTFTSDTDAGGDGTTTVMCTAGRPNIAVSASSLNFINVAVGQDQTQTVTITNNGTTALTYSIAHVPPVGQFTFPDGCTSGCTIPPPPSPNTATFNVRFTPTNPALLTTRIDITNNDPDPGDNVKSINVSGTGDQGVIATVPASPNPLDFGGVTQGSTKTLSFTLRNSGNVTITGISGTLNNPNLGFQFDTGTLPTSLTAGQQVSLNVVFAPPIGNIGGSTSITFNASWTADGRTDTTTATLQLTGIGQTTGYDVSPATRAFGDFRFDTRPTLTYQITNTAQAALTVLSAIDFTPELPTTDDEFAFAVTKNGAPIALTPPPVLLANEHLDVTITAQPNNRIGALSGRVTVRTNLMPDRQVMLSGNAITAGISVPSVVDFGAVDIDGTPPSQAIKLTNTGMATLDILSIAKVAGGSAAFTATPLPTTRTTVAPGADFTLNVSYAPTMARSMDQPETLVLDASLVGIAAGPSHALITLQGRGIDRVLTLDAAPPPVQAFRNPGAKAPMQTVTVRNDGEAVLKLSAQMIDDDPPSTGAQVWQLIDPSPVDIPGGASHDFLVRFVPTEVGIAPVGRLTLLGNDSARPMAMVTLTGTCVPRNVMFGPAILDLGAVAVGGEASLERAVAVHNMDASNAFTIHDILVEDSPAFSVPEAAGAQLAAAGTGAYTVVFAPTAEGELRATATLYLDEDPVPHAEVLLTGRALTVGVHGGGGCSAGGNLRCAAAIVLAALLLHRRRRARAHAARRSNRFCRLGLVAIAGTVLVSVDRARADDVVIGVFDPTPATLGNSFQLESPAVGPSGSWAASAVASYATDLLVFDMYDRGVQVGADHAIRRRSMLALGGAYAFLGRFEAGIRLPVYAQSGDDTGEPHVTPPDGTALGDLTIHGKAQLARSGTSTFGAAAHLTLPTASSGQFTGVDVPSLRIVGLAAWAPGDRLSLGASVGGVLRKRSVYRDAASISQGSGFVWGAGASYRVLDQLSLTAEVFGELTRSGRDELGMNTLALAPIEALVGATYRLESAWSLGAALGRGLTNGVGAPGLRGVVVMSYTVGVPKREPLRTHVAPGPVPELDRDRDGLADAHDSCPSDAEDKDGFEDNDGCPDLDNDRDGIADVLDKCPRQPEDKDGFEDGDGCPEADNDRDGIADAVDRCPGVPETVNGKDDDDGCADELDPVVASDPRSTVKAAEDTFNRGLQLMQQRQYTEACAAFEQSQRLDPQFGTQYQIAACYQKVGKLATAWNMYRELSRSDSNPKRRPKAGKIADALAPRVPKIRLVLRKKLPDAHVLMNGVNASALIGVDTPVDLGTYAFVATAAGHREWRKTVEVKEEGKVITVVIELAP
jgi:hypothetical protein